MCCSGYIEYIFGRTWGEQVWNKMSLLLRCSGGGGALLAGCVSVADGNSVFVSSWHSTLMLLALSLFTFSSV